MGNRVGIRREDKYQSERRSPLIPRHIEILVKSKNIDMVVQESSQRIFSSDEYLQAGASISHNLYDCEVILGVKEIPVSVIEPGKTYVFFAHVLKGQPHNMPMLRRLMELKCNLIDYEKIVDDMGKRLVYFGKYAGLAGMINSIQAAGLRLKEFGHETPFLEVKQAHEYSSIKEAKQALARVGEIIAEKGLPKAVAPFTVAFTGYGNVSCGAQEMLGMMPVIEITPEQLLTMQDRASVNNKLIYKVIFKEEDLVKPLDPNSHFNLDDYYAHPQRYASDFERYLPHISLLMNCIYWESAFPRILTRQYLQENYTAGKSKLIAVGDITCDVHGSIECNERASLIEEPLYIYNPTTGEINCGHKGEGLLMMAVDILPAEISRDSSEGFSNVFLHFVKPLADCDFSKDYQDVNLPGPLKRALILHRGKPTPGYQYLLDYVNENELVNSVK